MQLYEGCYLSHKPPKLMLRSVKLAWIDLCWQRHHSHLTNCAEWKGSHVLPKTMPTFQLSSDEPKSLFLHSPSFDWSMISDHVPFSWTNNKASIHHVHWCFYTLWKGGSNPCVTKMFSSSSSLTIEDSRQCPIYLKHEHGRGNQHFCLSFLDRSEVPNVAVKSKSPTNNMAGLTH